MYQLPHLSKIKGLAHGFSERSDGNMGFRFGAHVDVAASRRSLARRVHSSFGLENGVGLAPMQENGEGVMVVTPGHAGHGTANPVYGMKCEAMITSSEEIFLLLPAADCAMIILYDPVRRVLGLIHAGRESTMRGIASTALRTMGLLFGSSPRQIIAGVGPAIRQPSYVLDTFPPVGEADSPWRDFCRVRPDGVEVDFVGFSKKMLADAGVNPRNIEDCGVDTFTDDRFFSHRRSKAAGEPEGRHTCVVGMVPVS